MSTSKERFLTSIAAAKRLGVHVNTIHQWFKKGRIKGKVVQVTRNHILIDPESLRNANMIKCRWCGRLFRSARPNLAVYCCVKHRDAAAYAEKKAALKRAAKAR